MTNAPSAHDPGCGDRPARSLLRCGRGQHGFTLIEVLISAFILIVGIMSLFGLLDATAHSVTRTHDREGATNLARAVIEDAHEIPYAQLSPADVESELQEMSGLADASTAPGWQIVRNGVTYTVTATECAIDDGKDGYGSHTGTTFCPESSIEGTADSQPVDFKRVNLTISWKDGKREPSISTAVTFTAAGSAVGLSASGLQLIFPAYSKATAPLITSEPSGGELEFEVQAPTGTSRVDWALNGARQSTSATHGEGTKWTFWWKISGLSDGAYQISAQAVNEEGVVGPPVTITVTLIRNTPIAPKSIVGGYNTINVGGAEKKVAEFEWLANSELNILGYRVYRPTSSGKKELVCPSTTAELSLTTSCIDFSPPSPTAANLTYEFVALYRRWEGEPLNATLSKEVYEGTPAKYTVTGGEPLPAAPNPPSALKVEKDSEGAVVLTWKAPTSGPTVSFYRIYRGSKEYTARYGVTGSGSIVTFSDTESSSTHKYWVTAVGTNLAESEFLGPVEG